MRTTFLINLAYALSVCLPLTGCGSSNSSVPKIPQAVLSELDAIRDISKATHEEYERLYTSIVFSTEEKKTAAARWYRTKELAWLTIQVEDLRTRRQGLPDSRLEGLVFFNAVDSYIDAKPPVFVETTYYPRYVEKELVSVARLKTLREDFEAAQLRLMKALLEIEQTTANSAKP